MKVQVIALLIAVGTLFVFNETLSVFLPNKFESFEGTALWYQYWFPCLYIYFIIIRSLVRSRRLELPQAVKPTTTSTLRVYQFRHDRIGLFKFQDYLINFKTISLRTIYFFYLCFFFWFNDIFHFHSFYNS